MQLLKNKRVLITGGTSGIGKEMAIQCAKQGAHVCIWGTHAGRAEEVKQRLQEARCDAEQVFLAHIVDVAHKPSVDTAVLNLLTMWPQVDVLINNAGITRDGLLMKMKEEDWDLVLATNLKSVYNLCQALVRPMMKARSGSIINISSVVGLTGNAGQVNYAASKSGVIGFTKALAQELASRTIRVNCIAPGFIETPMTDALTPEQREEILKQIPLKRMGSAEEVAHAAVFLASDLAQYITGQVLTVDGGMVM